MNDLPLDVIRAIKKLDDFINQEKYIDIHIDSYIGTVKLTNQDGSQITITPIALDMTMLRQTKDDRP